MARAPLRPRYELTCHESLDELRAVATLWDALWQRSGSNFPTARAETTAQCALQFGPRGQLCALSVSRNGRLLAALPLVGMPVKRVLTVGKLPGSVWTPGGDLLLDPDCDTAAVLDELVTGLRRVPWPIVWLEAAQTETPRWREFAAALERAGMAVLTQQRYSVGQFSIGTTWESFEQGWSGNHRRALRRAVRAADTMGTVALEFHAPPPIDEVERLLRRGFAVEDASWKGTHGSSVLKNPGVFEFFLRQANRLAAWHQLALAFLTLDGKPIAFEYALSAKGTYAPLKVGYDPRFAHLKPGQLLRWHLFRSLFADRRWVAVDFVGPLSDATARWSTASYPLARMVVAPRATGRLLLAAYRLAPRRRATTLEQPPQLGATAEFAASSGE